MPDDPDPAPLKLPKSDQTTLKYRLGSNLQFFFEKTADDICIPRNEIVSISSDATIKDALLLFKTHLFSRYPVHEKDNPDEIVGLLSIKDILLNVDTKKTSLVSDVMKRVHFISFSEPISQVFETMQKKKVKLVVVINEYGEMDGMIGAEDLLEVLVGNLYDEYDSPKPSLIQQLDNKVVVSGKYELESLNAKFRLNLDASGTETLSGYISHKLGRIPEIGETFDLDNIRFTVLNSDTKKIELLSLEILNQ